jgi:hypothetical protein
MSLAPVAVFAYRRAQHLLRAVSSLAANPQALATDLHIFCDGPKGSGDEIEVQAVRELARGFKGFRSLTVAESPRNRGLAESIIAGVAQVVEAHGRVIVVEDDLVLSPHFLAFMNQALDCYADDARVASVHGYVLPVRAPLPETFFLQGADCWGWATWRRAWRHFNPDAAALLKQIRERRIEHDFDFDGAFSYTGMLENHRRGKVDSWAIRWHASCYLEDMLTLYPGRSLVRNMGFDASGVHCETSNVFDVEFAPSPVTVNRIAIEPSPVARAAYVDFYRSLGPRGMARRAWRRAAQWMRRGDAQP